jgi:hypothetical protein
MLTRATKLGLSSVKGKLTNKVPNIIFLVRVMYMCPQSALLQVKPAVILKPALHEYFSINKNLRNKSFIF